MGDVNAKGSLFSFLAISVHLVCKGFPHLPLTPLVSCSSCALMVIGSSDSFADVPWIHTQGVSRDRQEILCKPMTNSSECVTWCSLLQGVGGVLTLGTPLCQARRCMGLWGSQPAGQSQLTVDHRLGLDSISTHREGQGPSSSREGWDDCAEP